jgi:anti-anti-sigma regulatory factor
MAPAREVGPVPDAVPPLMAHIAREGDASVLRVRGALSGLRVPFLESVVQRLEKRGDARLIVDLREVSVTDAAGAAMLRRAAERMLRAGRSMTVIESGDVDAEASGG